MISLIPWKQIAIGLAIAFLVLLSGASLKYKWDKATIVKLNAELAASTVIWQTKFDALSAQLADAKTAGAAAVKAKEQADAEAAKRLAAERKKWKELYAKDPEARAWADSPVPAGVLDRLRD